MRRGGFGARAPGATYQKPFLSDFARRHDDEERNGKRSNAGESVVRRGGGGNCRRAVIRPPPQRKGPNPRIRLLFAVGCVSVVYVHVRSGEPENNFFP